MSPVLASFMGKMGAALGTFNFHRWKRLDATDLEIVRSVGQRNEILVGPDCRQSGEPLIAAAIRETGARIVWLPSEFADSKLWDQSWWLINHWLKVSEAASNLSPGECCYVRAGGGIVKVDPNTPVPRRKRRTGSERPRQLRGPYARLVNP